MRGLSNLIALVRMLALTLCAVALAENYTYFIGAVKTGFNLNQKPFICNLPRSGRPTGTFGSAVMRA